jgi:MtrB/PioB family decaheme-associated outer membrane protein
MNTQRNILRLRPSVLAVHGALGLMAAAQAQTDPALVEQTQPKSRIEFGIGNTSPYTAKANEWTGIQRKGSFGIAGFELQGGSPYDSTEARRWRLSGSDLGTDSRSLSAENGVQGWFRVRLGYDELRRNASDSYQTPYLGIGSNSLSLPSTWLVPVVPRLSTTGLNARGLSPDVTAANAIVGGVSTAPTPAQLAQAAAVQAADLAAFHPVDLFTKRTRFSLGWDHEIDSHWSFKLDVSSEHKAGLKALTGHADAPAETSTVLPHPINQDDDKLKLGLSFTGAALQGQASYEVSAFTNQVPYVEWRMWSVSGVAATSPVTATMSTGAPSNLFQKFQLGGSYQLAPETRIVAHASHARSAQDEAFPTDASSRATLAAGYVLPRASAQALVVNESAGLKLFQRSSKALSLSAGINYDLRENRTPVNTYIYYDNNTPPAAAPSPFAGLYGNPAGLGTNVNINQNRAYSKRVFQGELDARYELGPGSLVKAVLNSARTHRYCLDAWIACANAPEATENTLHADWHGHLGDRFSGSLGVSSARRKVEYNELAFLSLVPMANESPSTATGALAGTTAYGTLMALGLGAYGRSSGLAPAPATGSAEAFYFTPAGTSNFNNTLQQLYYGNRNRIVDEKGLRTFDQADRDRNKASGTLIWQASEALALQAGAEYVDDRFRNSVAGVQNATRHAFNVDLSYAGTDDLDFSLFATLEGQRTRVAGFSIQTGVNSTATAVNGATAISGAGACNTTIAARNASYKIDDCLNWRLTAHDRTTTLGASLSKNKLLKGRLDLSGSLVYSDGRSDNDVAGGFYVNNPYAGIAGAASKDIAAYFIPAAGFPTNTAKSLELRLGGTYHLTPEQALRVGYSFKRLETRDWGYEGMQPGGLAVNLPTFESAPQAKVHTVGLSYVLSFR